MNWEEHYDEMEPVAPKTRPGWMEACELFDAACQMAFGILCVELIGYLLYLYWSGAEGKPLVALIRPLYQNFLYVPGMVLIALGGVLGLRR